MLISTATVSAQTAKVNLQQNIVIPVADMRLDTLLSIISKQAGTSRTVHVGKGRQSLSSLLTGLRERTGIGYRILESHIILVDAPMPVITKKAVATVTPAKVIPSAKVVPPARFVVTPIAVQPTKKADPVLVAPVLINTLPALETRKRDTATFSTSVT